MLEALFWWFYIGIAIALFVGNIVNGRKRIQRGVARGVSLSADAYAWMLFKTLAWCAFWPLLIAIGLFKAIMEYEKK